MFDKLEDLRIRLDEILNELQEPDVANDQNRFRKLMKEQNDLTPIVEAYNEYKECKQAIEDSLEMLEEESDEEMRELAKEELNDNKKRVEELEQELKILLLPKDPNDEKNVIVEIRAGAGGDEAALFAAEIYRMYMHYAESQRWKVELVECEEIGIGGMKNVTFMIDGKGAYSKMKYESGVHRVQRVPETESGGRIHTSTITVAVMPEAEDVDIQIDEKDIRIDVMRASGNGGQCVNTTDSAVRLTHYPTGIVIYSQTEKSQLQNKDKAFALLRAKLYDLECQKRHDAEAEARKSQIGSQKSMDLRNISIPVTTVFWVSLMPTISTGSLSLSSPRSTRPVATVPRPEMVITSSTAIRNGRSLLRAGVGMYSSTAFMSSRIASIHLASPSRAPRAEPRMTGMSSPGKSYSERSSRVSISTRSISSSSSTMSHLFRKTTM